MQKHLHISYVQSLVAGPQPSPPVLSVQDVEALIDRKTKRPKSSQSPALAMMTTGEIMTLASLLADAISAVNVGIRWAHWAYWAYWEFF